MSNKSRFVMEHGDAVWEDEDKKDERRTALHRKSNWDSPNTSPYQTYQPSTMMPGDGSSNRFRVDQPQLPQQVDNGIMFMPPSGSGT